MCVLYTIIHTIIHTIIVHNIVHIVYNNTCIVSRGATVITCVLWSPWAQDGSPNPEAMCIIKHH